MNSYFSDHFDKPKVITIQSDEPLKIDYNINENISYWRI